MNTIQFFYNFDKGIKEIIIKIIETIKISNEEITS